MRAVAVAPRSILNILIAKMLQFDDHTLMAEAHLRSVSLRAKLVSGPIRPLPPFHRERLGPGAGGALPLFSQWRGFDLDKFSVEGVSVARASTPFEFTSYAKLRNAGTPEAMQFVLSESYNDGKGDPALCIAADEIFSTVFSSWHGYSKVRTGMSHAHGPSRYICIRFHPLSFTSLSKIDRSFKS